MPRLRRKGKPNNLKSAIYEVYDRRTQDKKLKDNFLVPDEVDDPYEYGAKIIIMKSIKSDVLMDMKSKNQIDACDYIAGRHWQKAYELSEIGAIKSMDPGKEAVDGGRLPDVVTEQTRKALWDLRAARNALGAEGEALIRDVLGKHTSLKNVCIGRGMYSEAERKYIGRRFRECLQTLALRFGYTNGAARQDARI